MGTCDACGKEAVAYARIWSMIIALCWECNGNRIVFTMNGGFACLLNNSENA